MNNKTQVLAGLLELVQSVSTDLDKAEKARIAADKAMEELKSIAGARLDRDFGPADKIEQVRKAITDELDRQRWLEGRFKEGREASRRLIGAMETLAAFLDAGGRAEDVGEDVIDVIGQRVTEGSRFVHWFEEHVAEFNRENGHVRLAKLLNDKCVFHAWKSNDPGVRDMIWDKVARRWEWMAGHPGGFVVAGRELVGIDRERVGRILMQHGHLSQEEVALQLALHGGEDMATEVRAVIGVEPCAGGVFEPALEFRLVGHQEPVTAAKRLGLDKIVTAGEDGCVKLWDLNSGKCIKDLVNHAEAVYGLDVVGGRLATASWDLTIALIDPERPGQVSQQIPHKQQLTKLTCIDDETFATCGDGERVCIWRLDEGDGAKIVASFGGHEDESPNCLLALGDGRLATGEESSIAVHDLEKFAVVALMTGHKGPVNDLALLDDGRLVSGSFDHTIRVWPASFTGVAEDVLLGHDSCVNCVSVLETGLVVSGDTNGWFRVWGEGGNQGWSMRTSLQGHWGPIWGITSLEGSSFVSYGDDTAASVWSVPRFDESSRSGHQGDISAGAVLRSGTVVTGDSVGGVVVWRPIKAGESAEAVHLIQADGSDSRDEQTSVDSMCAFAGGVAWILSGRTQVEVWKEDGPWRGSVDLRSLIERVFGSENALLLGCAYDEGFALIDADKMETQWRLDWDWVRTSAFLDDPGRVVLGGWAGRVALVNVENGLIEDESQVGEEEVSDIYWAGPKSALIRFVGGTTMWRVQVDTGDHSAVLRGIVQVWACLRDEIAVVERVEGDVEVWGLGNETLVGRLGGLDGGGIAAASFLGRRLVLCLRGDRSWVAYDL